MSARKAAKQPSFPSWRAFRPQLVPHLDEVQGEASRADHRQLTNT